MFYNIRRAVAHYLYPEGWNLLTRQQETEARLRALLKEAQDTSSSLRFANKSLEAKVAFRNTAIQELSDELALSRARLQTCEIKAANWNYLICCHESAAVSTFVVFAPAADGTLEPISSEPEALTTAIYEDRLKNGVKQAG